MEREDEGRRGSRDGRSGEGGEEEGRGREEEGRRKKKSTMREGGGRRGKIRILANEGGRGVEGEEAGMIMETKSGDTRVMCHVYRTRVMYT